LVERLGFIEAICRFIATALPAIAGARAEREKMWDSAGVVGGIVMVRKVKIGKCWLY